VTATWNGSQFRENEPRSSRKSRATVPDGSSAAQPGAPWQGQSLATSCGHAGKTYHSPAIDKPDQGRDIAELIKAIHEDRQAAKDKEKRESWTN
jgi:hypothetical protein